MAHTQTQQTEYNIYLYNDESIYNKIESYVNRICKSVEKNPTEKAIINEIYYLQTSVYNLVCQCIRDPWQKLTKGERYKVAREELAREVEEALNYKGITIRK
jgi:hypothetical protein